MFVMESGSLLIKWPAISENSLTVALELVDKDLLTIMERGAIKEIKVPFYYAKL